MIKPYYEHANVTIFCGDARDFGDLPTESIITDPIWPNSVFSEDIDPKKLLMEVLAFGNFPGCSRLAIHLGCDSDPRFLLAVPNRWPFFRVCWMDYARPSYKGRLLYGSDVAYLFGEPPPARKGQFLIPGKCMAQRTVNVHLRQGILLEWCAWTGRESQSGRGILFQGNVGGECFGGALGPSPLSWFLRRASSLIGNAGGHLFSIGPLLSFLQLPVLWRGLCQ